MEQEKTGRKKGFPLLRILLLTVIFILLAVYLAGVWFYRGHYLRGTRIDQVEVSNLAPQDLERQVNEYTLQITERRGDGTAAEEFIWGNEIGLSYGSEDVEQGILKGQNSWLWPMAKGEEYNIKDMLTFDDQLLLQKIQDLHAFDEDFARLPENARVSAFDPQQGFTIIPENPGNTLDPEKTAAVIRQALKELESEVNLEAEGCYLQPEIRADDPRLQQELASYQKCADVTITYVFGEHREILDGAVIGGWLSMEDGEIQVDAEEVEKYVASLRKRYDSIFRPRTFMTSYGQEIPITEGDYGWWMNYRQEEKELINLILAGESTERTPVYYQTAASYDAPDYGNTYVEINLTAQHLFLYVDGENVLESDLVSGNPSRGNGTPVGVYGITYKQRDATLEGEGYSSPVKWWMPFNKNIGLHDASWRRQFGGNYYQTSGSHGCINLPPAVAEQIFGLVSKGTPVICYELPGT